MASVEDTVDSKKMRREIFQPRDRNMWMTVEFVVETAGALMDRGKLHDFEYLVDNSIAIFQGNVVLKKFLLSKILSRCDKKDECIKMLKYYVELEKLLDNSSHEKKVKMDILLKIGTGYLQNADYTKTIKYTLKAQDIADELENKSGKVTCCRNLGDSYVRLADFKKAVEYYIKGLAFSTEIGDHSGMARNYGNLGVAYSNLGEHEKAIEYYKKGLTISTAIGDLSAIASNNGNLGNIYLNLGQYRKAIECYNKGLAISTEIGYRSGIASNNGNLGIAYRSLGKYKNAIEYCKKGLTFSTEIGDSAGIASGNRNLGNVYLGMEQYEKAIEYYVEGLTVSTEIGDKAGIASNNGNLGNAYRHLGEYEKAIEYCTKGLAMSIAIGDRPGIASNNGSLGNTYSSMGQYEKATEHFKKYLAISTEIGDRSGIASSNGSLGNTYLNMGQYEKAIECFKEGLAISTKIGDRSGIANINRYLGNAHLSLGKNEKAIYYYQKGLTISTEMGDRSGMGINNGNLGVAHCHLGEYEKAMMYLITSLEISAEIGDQSRTAADQSHLGNVYMNMGNYEKAIECCEKGLATSIKIGDRLGVAGNLGNLGNAYLNMGQYEKAIEYYMKSLATSTELGDKSGIATINGNLGNAYRYLGEYEKAVEYCKNSLAISTEIGNRLVLASSNGNLGKVYSRIGKYEEAIEFHKKSLEINVQLGNRSGIASETGNLGNNYFYLGNNEKAVQYITKSLSISTEIGDQSQIGSWIENLGNAYCNLQEYEKAIQYFTEGLAIKIEIGDVPGVATANGNLGHVYGRLGEYEKAYECFQKALAKSSEIGDRLRIACYSENLGNACLSLGRYKKAIEYYEEGLEMSVEAGDQRIECVCLGKIGFFYYLVSVLGLGGKEKNSIPLLQLAYSYLKRSIKCSDQSFSDLVVDENKTSFTNQYCGWYVILTSCFIFLGRFEAALLVADLAKAKTLQFSIEQRSKFESIDMADYPGKTWHNIDVLKEKDQISGIKKVMQLKENCCTVLFYSFNDLKFLDIWVLNGGRDVTHIRFNDSDDSSSTEDNILKNVTNLLNTFNLNLNRGSSFFHKVGSSSALSNLKVEEILQGRSPLSKKSLDCIKQAKTYQLFTSGNSPLRESKGHNNVSYEKISAISLKTKNNLGKVIQTYDIAVNINKKTFPPKHLEYLNVSLVSTKEGGYCLEVLEKLFASLIHPIKKSIKNSKLIIVPDKFLFFVPFSALLDENGSYLCENYSIQMTPSLHTLYSTMMVTKHANLGPALFVGNPRVGKITYRKRQWDESKIPPLPSAAEEVTFLASLFDAKPLVEHEATKREVLKCIHGASIVHIAAHGDERRGEIFLAPNPEWKQKGLATPNEKFYLLKESDIIDIDIKPLLVVLCCCHSGKGKTSSEGVIGLARAFLAAGARSVLATLWPLHDDGTKFFMKNFYSEIYKGTSVCGALKRTMNIFQRHQKCLCRLISVWAPFTIFGEDISFSRQDIEEIKKKSREILIPQKSLP